MFTLVLLKRQPLLSLLKTDTCDYFLFCLSVGVLFFTFQLERFDFRRQLLDHPVLVEEKSSLAEEYVLETYNWDRVAEETMSVYRAILEPKQSA